jgi:hypothetical protein
VHAGGGPVLVAVLRVVDDLAEPAGGEVVQGETTARLRSIDFGVNTTSGREIRSRAWRRRRWK